MKQNTQQKNLKKSFHHLEIEKVFEQVSSTPEGLSTQDAELRLEVGGKNIIPEKKRRSVFSIIFKELFNPIVVLLLFACGFSLVVGEWIDAVVIFIIIATDIVMGTVQTVRAERTAKSLLSMVKTTVKVLRDGEKTSILAQDLVVGDIVFFESGDKIPADIRILSCQNLKVDESILTGESNACEKADVNLEIDCPLAEQQNMLFSGTNVASGRASGVVVRTAFSTELGQIAEKLVDTQNEETPLKKRINKFSKQITFAVALVAVVLFVVLYLQGNSFHSIFLFVIALAVSAIPESLPLAVTLSLSIASKKMGKKNVIVKNLNAVESLGSCTVIASDKTGTLTLNQQTAKLIVLPNEDLVDITGSGYNDQGTIASKSPEIDMQVGQIARCGFLNNEAKLYKREGKFKSFGDSIDIAFLALAMKAKVGKEGVEILYQIPYESEKKYSAVFFKENEKMICTVKGSIEKVLSVCDKVKVGEKVLPLDEKKILAQHEKFASKGFRLIAVAAGKTTGVPGEDAIKNLTYLGLVGFIDPVRIETKPAVEACKSAGIKVLMITGDHPLTAYAIAKDIGIATNKSQVCTGKEVGEALLKGEKAFDKFVKTKTVFSRVTPTDKLEIVNSLKRQEEFVAVTGDGVNDAPAIKSAHIGIAMGSGTDVAKETADMIIADDNFSSIVQGVKEGRTAYSNIRKVTYLLLSQGIGEILFFFTSILCGLPMPLVATQLLYLNVVTNSLQDIALNFEKSESGILKESPRSTKESLFSKSLMLECLISGVVIGGVVFAVWAVLMGAGADLVFARSIVMALMVFMQNFHTFNCRSETKSIFQIPIKSNWFVWISVIVVFGMQILLMEVPFLASAISLTTVPALDLVYLFALSSIILIAMETYKFFVRRYRLKHNITKSY